MADELSFLEYDVDAITAANIARFETHAGRKLFPGDPMRMIIQAFSYIQSLQAADANASVNQNFISYATGTNLEAIGALFDVPRRAAEPARTTLRFSIGTARASATLIPQGTRATVEGSSLYFATERAAEIPAGILYVDVIAAASETGLIGNGYAPGEITTLVDVTPFITAVHNITPSADGSLVEDDDSLRERIREAPTRFSVAGPEDAYVTMTKDARADIDSVSVVSPTPRVLNIYFTLTGGAIPAPETLAEVAEYLNDRYRRPMSDLLNVLAPVQVAYSVDLTYWINRNDVAKADEIDTAIKLAVTDWVAWQRGKLGRDINPSELIRRIMNAGAKRVAVRAPNFTVMPPNSLGIIGDEGSLPPPTSGDEILEYGQIFEGAGRANLNWLKDNSTTAGYAFKAGRTGQLRSIAIPWRYADGYGGGAGHSGTFDVKLVSADSNNMPSTNALATLTGFVPEAHMVGTDVPMTVTLSAPASVLEGQLYFLTFRNTSSSPTVNWSSPNTIMTRLMPWEDWVRDGIGQRVVVKQGSTWAPWCSQSDPWGDGTNNGNGSYMAGLFTWEDGVKTGHTYWSTSMDDPLFIYGTHYVGERFTWGQGNIELEQIGVSLVKHGSPGNLTYHLEIVGGDELATGTITPSAEMNSSTSEWSYVELAAPVTMTDGTEYRLWFAASDGDASNYYEANVAYGLSGNADYLAHMWLGNAAYVEEKTGADWVAFNPDADLSISLTSTISGGGSGGDGSTINIVYGGLEDA